VRRPDLAAGRRRGVGPGHRQAAMTAEVTGLDLVTLTVAIVGAITGIVALVLQAIFFRNRGPRIRCELRWAWVHHSGRGALTMRLTDGIADPPDPAYGRPMFAVQVRNSGRTPATIERVAVDLPNGMTF